MRDNGSVFRLSANRRGILLFETISAKEAKSRRDCRGKLLGCSFFEKFRGLQCGLSGNPVPTLSGYV